MSIFLVVGFPQETAKDQPTMTRNWIVVGDPTSSGGRVLTGSPFTDIDDSPVARVNDMAMCPLHKGPFPIVDGDPTLIIDGQPVALHGSSLACGCKVLSAKQMRVFVDAGPSAGAPGRAVGSPVEPVNIVASNDKPAVCEECLMAGASKGAAFLGR
ncbi:PAAR domain-containing protein [Luteimonas sp. RD2P54]|uniref:PAAR domain-containing protein n=1 Tax=Luteimonas endophytica TaxID=3042023 RepID=A0ABT6J511_9GAMM|nr:PAAR domain-containing protein [Luteimonas endophytica]MDH5821906.1 PAAR domain-containing protein [Luteimonas endophytica]